MVQCISNIYLHFIYLGYNHYEKKVCRDNLINFPRPHLVIYLDASVEETKENIKRRNIVSCWEFIVMQVIYTDIVKCKLLVWLWQTVVMVYPNFSAKAVSTLSGPCPIMIRWLILEQVVDNRELTTALSLKLGVPIFFLANIYVNGQHAFPSPSLCLCSLLYFISSV